MKRRLKSSAKLMIFTALLLMSVVLALYLLLISELRDTLAQQGIELSLNLASPRIGVFFVVTAVLVFFVSSLVVDRALNPVRLMIAKVKEVGKARFIKPLEISEVASDDDELMEYAAAFNAMSGRLNGFAERQNRFISDAAHELSTPVTAINGHADLLLRWGKDAPEQLESGLQTIKAEAARMGELIDSLLLLARSDNARQVYSFENMLLRKLLDESVAEARVIAPDFVFETEADGKIRVKCDGYAMLRVLRIILSNAVKYSGDSRVVRVRAYAAGGLVYIAVKDFGIGIAPEHLPRLFERFYRADASRSKKTGSSGLGLSIAEEIVTAHGGEIRVESTEGEGSEFTLVLPV